MKLLYSHAHLKDKVRAPNTHEKTGVRMKYHGSTLPPDHHFDYPIMKFNGGNK